MSSVVIAGNTSGSITLQAPALSGSTVLTLPTTSATLITDSSGILNIGSGQLYKDASGNVGIGTSSPSVKLEVYGSSTGLKVTGASSTTAFFQATSIGVQDWSFGTRTTGKFVFNTGNLLAGTDVLTIDPSGNVGIGTSSPTRKLTAYTNVTDDNVILARSAAGNAYLGFADNATTDQGGLSVRIGSSGNAMVFNTGGTSERMRIDSSGRLLIAASSIINGVDTAPLQVSGGSVTPLALRGGTNGYQIAFYNSAGNAVIGSITGSNGSTTAYNTASDQRLKENIIDAPSALSSVNAIKVRSFDWKVDGSHQEYGYIAQELLEVAPEAVSVHEDSEQMMGVDFGKLTPRLVKAIQEQQTLIEALTARLTALEAK